MKHFGFLLLMFTACVTLSLFNSCGSKDDEPSYADQSLRAKATYTISGNDDGWTSDNEYIATVSNRVVTAQRVGTTVIRNGGKSFKVTVTPAYNTFKEPCVTWGASKATVKNFMNGYSLLRETDEYLGYDGKYKEFLTLYSFENSRLEMSSVILRASAVSSDEITEFAGERYVAVTYDEDEYYIGFITPDRKNLVILQLTTLNNEIVYMFGYGDATSSSSSRAAMSKACIEAASRHGFAATQQTRALTRELAATIKAERR